MVGLFRAIAATNNELPGFDYLLPAGGALGTSFSIFAEGRLDRWPVRVWTDTAGLLFQPLEDKGQFRVEIAPNVAPGPHLCRLYCPEGASSPFIFMVGSIPELMEWELGEKRGREALVPRLPVTINGRLKKPGEVDAFWLALDAGHTFRAEVHAQRLDLPLLAALALADDQGVVVASSPPGLDGDPELSCLINQSGNYRLLLRANLGGAGGSPVFSESEAAVYRLTLKAEPFTPPPADEAGLTSIMVNTDVVRPYRSAQQVTFPSAVHGHINPPGEQDRYVFEAQQGQQFPITLRAASLGSPLAGVLRILDPAGNPISQSALAPDPQLSWVAPADGEYTLVITDAYSRGGPAFAYRLELDPPSLHVAATVAGHAFRLLPGATVEVPVIVRRPPLRQFLLMLVALDLPQQVTAGSALVPAEGGEVKLALTASPDALPTNQPFRIALSSPDPLIPPGITAQASWPPRYAAPGRLLLNQTDQIWLTVLPKPSASDKP